MKPLIISFLLIASSGSAFDPLMVLVGSGEVTLLMIWGAVLLTAGRLIRTRARLAGDSGARGTLGLQSPGIGSVAPV